MAEGPINQRLSHEPYGAYGLHLGGVDGSKRYLVPAPPSWPHVEIVQVVSDQPDDETDVKDRETAVLTTESGGRILLNRTDRQVVITTRQPVDIATMAHPYLTPVATMFSFWDGRESFHAGGVVLEGGVWGLVGEGGAGKSSLVGLWARSGGEAFCDDVLVVHNGLAQAGPRLVDLEVDAAERLGIVDIVEKVPSRDKLRMVLDPVAAELPLRGWIFLEWSDQVELAKLPVAEALPRLASQRGLLIRQDSQRAFLEAAAMPAYRLSRPPEWRLSQDVIKLVTNRLGS